MKKEDWRLSFILTLKETVQFQFDTKLECEQERDAVLRRGFISGSSRSGTDFYYPKKRINKIEIYKL